MKQQNADEYRIKVKKVKVAGHTAARLRHPYKPVLTEIGELYCTWHIDHQVQNYDFYLLSF